MTTAQRISKARTHLLLDHPWWGTLSMRLQLEENSDPKACPTLQTNGTTLQFNPEYIATLTDKQLIGDLAHEVQHCALLHPYRIAGRDLSEWNDACDYAINPMLKAEGFEIKDGLDDPQFYGMGADQIYALRRKQKQENPDEPQPQNQRGNDVAPAGKPKPDGNEQPKPGSNGQQPPQPDNNGQPSDDQQQQPSGSGQQQSQQLTATDWQIAAEQATAAVKKAGKMSADADRMVKATHQSQTDWREILRRFIDQSVPVDYSWTPPNKRHIANGIYLPGIKRESMPRLVVAVDTSGSIDQPLLDIFANELTAILHEARPESVDVIYCDARVKHTESFSPDDAEIKLNAVGGGGTKFQPVFDHVAAEDNPPAALIYFTDLKGDEPKEPDYPVLWVTTEATSEEGPFGETVRLSQWR